MALIHTGADGETARERLTGETLAAPEIIDLEVMQVIRGELLTGGINVWEAELALVDLIDLPLRRVPHRPLLPRGWELRETVTAYDAAYVALAEFLDVELVTADARLTRAPGTRCRFDLVRGEGRAGGP
ncbi:MAG TPA: type II toxin-antitoxin system VapC family toxin [Acidimicrobiales bacterium]|nr:type II toxin-antitoxin system VapC family toxin [Acidimicrobiales bacterium]